MYMIKPSQKNLEFNLTQTSAIFNTILDSIRYSLQNYRLMVSRVSIQTLSPCSDYQQVNNLFLKSPFLPNLGAIGKSILTHCEKKAKSYNERVEYFKVTFHIV